MIFKATVNNPYPWHMVSCNFIALKRAIKFCYKKYNKNGFYISGLGLFISLGELNKSPGDGTCVGEPPGDFCDVSCCFLTSLEFFISLLFDVIPHLSVNTHFYRECYGFECAFFTHGRFFTLHSFIFVTQMRAETPHLGSSSVPALIELSLSADAWT